MKKVKKAAKKPASIRKALAGKRAAPKARVAKKASASIRRAAPSRPGARPTAQRSAKAVSRQHARSAAKMAASVMSRRAAKAETLTQPLLSERPPLKLEPRIPSRSRGKHSKGGHARSGRSHAGGSGTGNRSVVRVARTPQYNYMRAPGADSGFDVGDSVEVFCDHDLDGERVRGWIKGTVVQVDNKLVAVQFRSNVFLTDGWMVPDRILWYSLSSDQIRNTGVGKKAARVVIPEY
jgi:hypothetical protein